jgi:hypothetical protein
MFRRIGRKLMHQQRDGQGILRGKKNVGTIYRHPRRHIRAELGFGDVAYAADYFRRLAKRLEDEEHLRQLAVRELAHA